MDLKTYLLSIGMPDRLALAEACGTSYAHLRNIAYGSKPCGETLAINIDRETGGKVRCEDLRADVDWAYLRGTPIPVPETADSRSRPRPLSEFGQGAKSGCQTEELESIAASGAIAAQPPAGARKTARSECSRDGIGPCT